MTTRSRVTIGETRIAGTGADGSLYGVTSMTSRGGGKSGFRRSVCATCPWRLDAEIGRFPAQAYRESAPTAYDASFNMFACHESGTENNQACAGFLVANADNNLGARMAAMRGDYDPRRLRNDVPLYASYRAMAEANGVSPDDPVLAPFRANHGLELANPDSEES